MKILPNIWQKKSKKKNPYSNLTKANLRLYIIRCPGRPGVFAEPTRYCRFFRTTLFDELNIKLKKYILRSGKKLPNLDPNFFSDNNIQQQDSMISF